MTHTQRPHPTRPSPAPRRQRRENRKTPQRQHAPVPLAVWITKPEPDQHDTAPLGDGPGISRAVLHRSITEFSESGDRIVLAGADPAFLARFAESVSDRTVTHATLSTTTQSEDKAHAASSGHGEQALVVAPQPPHRTSDPDRYRTWARTLRPGGVLVVITTNPAGARRFRNHLGAVITTAEGAGLAYLQHIVAITAHVVGDRLLVPEHRRHGLPRSTERALVHVPAHHDLLVFLRPRLAEGSL